MYRLKRSAIAAMHREINLAAKAILSDYALSFEHRFAPPRMWRIDIALPDEKVAIEIDGGAAIQGRHTRIKGFIEDMHKSNALTMYSWALFRCTPQDAKRTFMLVAKWLKSGRSEETAKALTARVKRRLVRVRFRRKRV